jgi:hypothetical protein
VVGRRNHLHDIAEIYAKLLEQWLVFLWTRVLSLTQKATTLIIQMDLPALSPFMDGSVKGAPDL